MMRAPDTRITPEIARELCRRANSTAYIASSIAALGSQYVIGLKAVSCQSGDTLVQEQVTADGKEKVLNALGDAAAQLRGQLGESIASVEKFNQPLVLVTTSSLEALQSFTDGVKAYNSGAPDKAVPYFQRAVQLDPNFATAYLALATDYGALGESGRASEYYAMAFALRDHTSELERLTIAAIYYLSVTGEQQKAAETLQQLVEHFLAKKLDTETWAASKSPRAATKKLCRFCQSRSSSTRAAPGLTTITPMRLLPCIG
jgi:tetratricopeptide (TPR) repeat protein